MMYVWLSTGRKEQINGFILFLIAASVEVLDEVEVDYITLPGWMTSIEDCKTFHELPANAQAYIRKIEEITQIPGELTSADLIF